MRFVKKMAALLIFLYPFMSVGFAEASEVDLSPLEKVLDEAETSRYSILWESITRGEGVPDADALLNMLRGILSEALKDIVTGLKDVTAAVFLAALVRQLLADGQTGGAKGAGIACGAICAVTLTNVYVSRYRLAMRTVGGMTALTDTIVPILVSMLTLTGGTRSAALITPMGALASRLTTLFVTNGALKLCAVTAALSAADCMGGLRLKRMAGFTRSVCKWILTTAMGIYVALMATGGLVNGVYDGAVLKSARYAAGNLLPIVGGDVAGVMDSLASGVLMLRGSAGLACASALVALCLVPIVKCALTALACKFLAAVAEPVGDQRTLSLLEAFSGTMSLLTAIIATTAVFVLVLIGTAVGMTMRLSA